MDYDRTHQSHLESKYKGQKQNGTFLSFHPLFSSVLQRMRTSSHIMFLDAYEYYYGDHREEGHDLIREYCGSKTHFRVKIDVPHREHEHEISLPPQSRLSIPSVFLSGM